METETVAIKFRVGQPHPELSGKFFRRYDRGRPVWTSVEGREKMLQQKRDHGNRKYHRDTEFRKKHLDRCAKRQKTQASKAYKKAYKQSAKFKTAEKRKQRADYVRAHRAKDDCARLAHVFRARVRNALVYQGTRKNSKSAVLLGCTFAEFRKHIESQFLPGMSWENSSEWHVDHILPIAMFDLTDESQQLIAFNYRNQRPLWKEHNQSKSDRLPDGRLGRHVRKIIPFAA